MIGLPGVSVMAMNDSSVTTGILVSSSSTCEATGAALKWLASARYRSFFGPRFVTDLPGTSHADLRARMHAQ
jgi:hypothetical protein